MKFLREILVNEQKIDTANLDQYVADSKDSAVVPLSSITDVKLKKRSTWNT